MEVEDTEDKKYLFLLYYSNLTYKIYSFDYLAEFIKSNLED